MNRVWYHYRCESRLRQDLENATLNAHARFIFLSDASPALPEKAHQNVIWGLHDATLGAAEGIRKQAARGEKLYLLEITSPPEHDLYVSDVSVFQPVRESNNPSPDLRKAVCLQYWSSLVKFEDYAEGTYNEPEIVCFSQISLDCVKIADCIYDYVAPPLKLEPMYMGL